MVNYIINSIANPQPLALNFRHSIVPKKFTKFTLDGESYRCNNTCSDITELQIALKNIHKTSIENDYPPKLVRNRITEIQKTTP